MSDESLHLLYDYLAVHPLTDSIVALHPLPTTPTLATSSSSFIWRRFLLASNSPPSSDAPAGSCDLHVYQHRIPLHRRLHFHSSTVFYDHSPASNRPRSVRSLTVPWAIHRVYPSPHEPDFSLLLSTTSVSLLQLHTEDADVSSVKRSNDCVVLHLQLTRTCADNRDDDTDGSGSSDVPFLPTCAAWHPHNAGWVLVAAEDGWCHLYDVTHSLHPRSGGYDSGRVFPSSLKRFAAPLHSFHVCDAAVRAMCFPSDAVAPRLAFATDDGHVVLTSTPFSLLPDASSSSSSISAAPSPVALNVYTGLPISEEVHSIAAHSSAVTCVAFCHSLPSLMLTASAHEVKVFDLSSTSAPFHALPHPSPVLTLAVIPSPSQPLRAALVAAAAGSCVYVWEVAVRGREEQPSASALQEPRLLFVHRLHSADVVSVAWQEEQPWLLSSADAAGVLHLWEMNETCHSDMEPIIEPCDSSRMQKKRRRVERRVAELKEQRREMEETWRKAAQQTATTEPSAEAEEAKVDSDDASDGSSDESDGAYDEDEEEEDEAGEDSRRGRSARSPKGDSTSCIPLHRKGGRGRVSCPYHLSRKEPCPDRCPYRATILAAQRKKRKERDERRRVKGEKTATAAQRRSPQPLLSLTPPSAEEPIECTPVQTAQERGQPPVADSSPESQQSPQAATLCTRARCDFAHPASERCPEVSSSDKGSQESKEPSPPQRPAPPAKKRLPVERLPEPAPRRAGARPPPVHLHQPSPPSSMQRSQSLLGGDAGGSGGVGGGSRWMQSPTKSRSEPLRLTPPSPAVTFFGSGQKRERERESHGKREASENAGQSARGVKRRKEERESPPAGMNRLEKRQWEQDQAKRRRALR